MANEAAPTAVSVGTTPVQLLPTGRIARERVIIFNNHATQDIFVGDSTVTTANGLPIKAGQSREFEGVRGTLYAVASGAATDVRVLELF